MPDPAPDSVPAVPMTDTRDLAETEYDAHRRAQADAARRYAPADVSADTSRTSAHEGGTDPAEA